MSHTVLNPMCQVSKSHNEIDNKFNLNSEAMSHNTCTLPNSDIRSKSPIKMHISKKHNINPSRGISFKTRVKSMLHFQIKGRWWRSRTWGIDSRRDMRPGGVGGWDRERDEILWERALCWKNKREWEREEEEGGLVNG
jgi:hypothetical protein